MISICSEACSEDSCPTSRKTHGISREFSPLVLNFLLAAVLGPCSSATCFSTCYQVELQDREVGVDDRAEQSFLSLVALRVAANAADARHQLAPSGLRRLAPPGGLRPRNGLLFPLFPVVPAVVPGTTQGAALLLFPRART